VIKRISARHLLLVTGSVFVFVIAIFLPARSASPISSGDLIKGPTDAVYYYGQNGKRFVFPNFKTYSTWYADFSTVKTITADELASIPLGGNVTYRPGVKLVKVTTAPKVYAVAVNGVLRWIKTEEIARALYGSDWNKKVDDMPDAFFVNYTVGADIASSADFSPSAQTTLASSINVDKKSSKLSQVKHWLYLIGADLIEDIIRSMIASSYDMLVIQYIPSEKGLELYQMAEVVRRLHAAPKPKLVIAYIDIGQAETVRTYWKSGWRVGKPDWIVSDDPDG
jgi:hypothetical protein